MTTLKSGARAVEAKTALIPIGAVAKAPGINASTLRIWEHRYGLPKPHRTGGGARRYAPSEVQRLKLIKALVDVNTETVIVVGTRGDRRLKLIVIVPRLKVVEEVEAHRGGAASNVDRGVRETDFR